MTQSISGGVVHKVPDDLRKTLTSDPKALTAWESLTPLARNEWICWAISVKKPGTRKQHVERVRTELKEGMRRPCCWLGCIHRPDKSISPSVQYVLYKRKGGEKTASTSLLSEKVLSVDWNRAEEDKVWKNRQ